MLCNHSHPCIFDPEPTTIKEPNNSIESSWETLSNGSYLGSTIPKGRIVTGPFGLRHFAGQKISKNASESVKLVFLCF